jgi:hypothetical protein
MPTTAQINADAIKSYLNDHQAGSIAGLELAKSLAKDHPGDEFLSKMAKDVEADQDTLERLMEKFGTSGNPAKQAGAYVMEKVGTTLGAADDDLGFLRKLETLTMGVKGKLCLWEALTEVSEADQRLEGFNFDRLTAGAKSQLDGLERERLKAARKAFLG